MQKAPKRSLGAVSVTDEAIALLNDRRATGILTYGMELLTENGRDALWDAVEEAADLYLYLLQHYLELKTKSLGRGIGGKKAKKDRDGARAPISRARGRRKALR